MSDRIRGSAVAAAMCATGCGREAAHTIAPYAIRTCDVQNLIILQDGDLSSELDTLSPSSCTCTADHEIQCCSSTDAHHLQLAPTAGSVHITRPSQDIQADCSDKRFLTWFCVAFRSHHPPRPPAAGAGQRLPNASRAGRAACESQSSAQQLHAAWSSWGTGRRPFRARATPFLPAAAAAATGRQRSALRSCCANPCARRAAAGQSSLPDMGCGFFVQ